MSEEADHHLPSLISPANESSDCQTSLHNCIRGTRTSSVSARKLANALWGMNKIPSLNKERMVMSSRRHSTSTEDPPHTPGSKIPRRSGRRRRMKCQIYDDKSRRARRKGVAPPDLQTNSGLILLKKNACCRGQTSEKFVGGGGDCRLKDLGNCLAASRELLKAVIHVLGPCDRHFSAISLVFALHAEIYHASEHLACLMAEKRSDCCETVCRKKRFSEQKEMLSIRCLIQPIIKELQSEKILRRRTERINKELGLECTKLKDSLTKTSQELENERRSREVAEKMCSDLSREYGERKAAVEELKRRFVKVQEELEEEREMLQIADEWREERVQMKIYEAKLEFEEKSAVVGRLRDELEAFLNAKRTEEPEADDEDGESQSSGLHSIELNIEQDNKTETRLDENYMKGLWEHMLSDSKDAIAQCLAPEEDEACEEESNVAEMVKAMRERVNGEIVEKGGKMLSFVI